MLKVRAHIKHAKTAKEAWENLKKFHLKSNLSNKVFLMRKLFRMQLINGGNMQEHISSMTDIIEKLKAVGEEIFTDKIIVSLLLSSLPSEYDTLITALETREAEVTSEAVKSKLIEVWKKQNNKHDKKDSAMIANVKHYKNNNNHNIKCYLFLSQKGTHEIGL